MAIVPACVHHADGLAAPLRLDLRGERQVDLFRDRQRIHVGAQGDHRPRTTFALQQADDAGFGDAFAHLIA